MYLLQLIHKQFRLGNLLLHIAANNANPNGAIETFPKLTIEIIKDTTYKTMSLIEKKSFIFNFLLLY